MNTKKIEEDFSRISKQLDRTGQIILALNWIVKNGEGNDEIEYAKYGLECWKEKGTIDFEDKHVIAKDATLEQYFEHYFEDEEFMYNNEYNFTFTSITTYTELNDPRTLATFLCLFLENREDY